MKPTIRVFGAVLLVAGSAMPALAQSDGQSPPPSDVSRQGGELSDKLNTTGGVIHPQGGVDPDIQKVPSTAGTMPVIPPPGSPGGRSDVVPK